jgi:hypothetical protein
MDAAKPEPMPVEGGWDVGEEAVQFVTGSGHPDVAEDLKARIAMGERKYGTRLKAHNGRNAVMDAYQEALDGINYATQACMEGVIDPTIILVFMSAAVNLKLKLNELEAKHGEPNGKA